jgi:hypothetical protein
MDPYQDGYPDQPWEYEDSEEYQKAETDPNWTGAGICLIIGRLGKGTSKGNDRDHQKQD